MEVNSFEYLLLNASDMIEVESVEEGTKVTLTYPLRDGMTLTWTSTKPTELEAMQDLDDQIIRELSAASLLAQSIVGAQGQRSGLWDVAGLMAESDRLRKVSEDVAKGLMTKGMENILDELGKGMLGL